MEVQFYRKENLAALQSRFGKVLAVLDIYYQPEFLASEALLHKGVYEYACVEMNEDMWIYPYLIIPIPGTTYFDISSPYGYAGPYTTNTALFSIAEKLFIEQIRKRMDIVTEFIRYHYVYNQDASCRFEINCNNLLNRQVVVLDFRGEHLPVWEKSFSGTNRNLVRKLRNNGFQFAIRKFEKSDIPAFIKLYHETMQNAGAQDFYYFDEAYFESLQTGLQERLLLARIEKDDTCYAAALFFVSGVYLTYYLSARNTEFFKVPASNMLLSELSLWAEEKSFEYLNFGGGLSLDTEDSLFKFKRNFAREIKPFYIGKRVHNHTVYMQLQQDYVTKFGEEKYKQVNHILQFYRI